MVQIVINIVTEILAVEVMVGGAFRLTKMLKLPLPSFKMNCEEYINVLENR